MFLSHDELIGLTGKSQRAAQIRVLRYMGIEHRRRPDGSVAVLKSHIDKELDGNQTQTLLQKRQPEWGEIK